MINKRIDREKNKLRRCPSKLDIKFRHEKLMAIEGWYEIIPTIEDIPSEYAGFVQAYENSGSRLKITRWLLREKITDDKTVAKIGKYLSSDPIRFKLSCRHNDLLRLAESPHYISCFKNWRGAQQLRYLADPDIAIVYVPDKAGHYLWRALIRLMLNPDDVTNGFALLMHRSYGDTNELAVQRCLNSIYPLYFAKNLSQIGIDTSLKPMRSASTHSNPIVWTHMWSDHYCILDYTTNQLIMYGKKFCTK